MSIAGGQWRTGKRAPNDSVEQPAGNAMNCQIYGMIAPDFVSGPGAIDCECEKTNRPIPDTRIAPRPKFVERGVFDNVALAIENQRDGKGVRIRQRRGNCQQQGIKPGEPA